MTAAPQVARRHTVTIATHYGPEEVRCYGRAGFRSIGLSGSAEVCAVAPRVFLGPTLDAERGGGQTGRRRVYDGRRRDG